LATADNHVVEPVDATPDGIPIYARPNSFGFIIVVEARPGSSGRPIDSGGVMTEEGGIIGFADFPGLQILANRPLGNGSAIVCDIGPPPAAIGGVPAVNPVDFTQSDALADFACRFVVHTAGTDSCTLNDLGNFAFASTEVTSQTRQFCSVPAVGREIMFPTGETELTVRIRDTGGNAGPPASIIVRVP
jgi:hypothetical protein